MAETRQEAIAALVTERFGPATRPPPRRDTHTCPGGCTRQVPATRFACRTCWYRLPAAIRRPITAYHLAGDRVRHADAMLDADRWYRDNPPKRRTTL